MKNKTPPNLIDTLPPAADNVVALPICVETGPTDVEYLMPYGAVAKAIFIKANGHAAYNYSRRTN